MLIWCYTVTVLMRYYWKMICRCTTLMLRDEVCGGLSSLLSCVNQTCHRSNCHAAWKKHKSWGMESKTWSRYADQWKSYVDHKAGAVDTWEKVTYIICLPLSWTHPHTYITDAPNLLYIKLALNFSIQLKPSWFQFCWPLHKGIHYIWAVILCPSLLRWSLFC